MQLTNISFTGKIIDAHVHSGNWWRNGNLYDHTKDIDIFTKEPLSNGDTIEKVVVSNLDCMVRTNNAQEPIHFMSDEIEGNTKLAQLAKQNNKILPLATCQPNFGTVDNIKKLFSNNPNTFYGLKFHPEQLDLPANSALYSPYMEFAQKNDLPCLFHSGQTFDSAQGIATKVSRPTQIYELAKRFPKVPVIMAHLGGNEGENTIFATKLIIESVTKNNSKLYADISWVDCDNPQKSTLSQVIKLLKENNALDRIMFGTDAPLGRFGLFGENNTPPKEAYVNNINDIKKMIKRDFGKESEEIINKIFYKNAQNLYLKKLWKNNNTHEKITKFFKSKTGLLISTALVLLSGITYLSLQKSKIQTTNKSQIKNISVANYNTYSIQKSAIDFFS